jgi:PAS domain S-box-containing protein
VSTSLVSDAGGGPPYIVAQVQDTTEARADKENLEHLIRQNRSILASVGEGIHGLDLDERTSFANPAAERMLGYRPGELAGRHQHDIVVSHLNADGVPYPEGECPVHAALRDGDVHSSSDEVFRRKDGTTFPVEYVSTPIREGGEVIGAVVTFRDITGRKRADEALRKSEARFRLLAEKMSDLVCLHEPDGRYIYISPSCRRLLGYAPEELLGTDPYDLFHPEDLERIRTEAHDKALEGQGVVSVIYRIRKKSGEYT